MAARLAALMCTHAHEMPTNAQLTEELTERGLLHSRKTKKKLAAQRSMPRQVSAATSDVEVNRVSRVT
jgi:hypothetical protein